MAANLCRPVWGGRQPDRVRMIVPIQVLRAVAAIVVVVGHFQGFTASPKTDFWVPYVKLATAGVDLFFIISGFVMVYASEPMFGRVDGPLNFFARRAIRIIPLYWLATSVYLLIAAALPSLVDADYSAQFIASSYLFIPVARPGGAMNPVVGQGWSLNYEMLFYVVFAVAIFGSRRTAVAAASLVLLCLVVAGQILAPSSPVLATWTNSIVLEFIFGILLGLAYREGLRLPQWLSGMLIVAGVALFYVNMCILEIPGTLANGLAVSQAFAYGIPAVLIVAGATFGNFSLGGVGWRMFAVAGDASYALYLFHAFPVRAMIFLFQRVGVNVDTYRFSCLAATVGVSLAFAVMIYYLFERPVTQALRSAIGKYPILRGIRLESRIDTDIATKPRPAPTAV
jgi:exopolysaccharide production protein ExoZ